MKRSFFQKFRGYFSISLLIKSFLGAAALSIFLLADFFGWHNQAIESASAIVGFYLLVTLPRGFWAGFFLGLFWFWWIGLSFRYYDLAWMIPLVILFVASVYGAIFELFYAIAAKLPYSLLFRALFLWIVSFIHPFGFNWFIPELALLHSYFFYDKLSFALFLLGVALLALLPLRLKTLALLPLLFILQKPSSPPYAPLKIELITTHIPQDKKWDKGYLHTIIEENFQAIRKAIDKRADIAVLPESAFPLFLNENPDILSSLLDMSHSIAIVTGGLQYSEGKIYNSTYVFDKGRYIILNKVVLVPFGEEIPLPRPLAKIVNRLFFGGAEDYDHAKSPQTYTIKGSSFTNAICYEATHPLIYQTSTPYIIAISNNAWFLPSYEPNLQNLIIKYYATMHNKRVYHATNIAKTEVLP
ncbi:MAG: apolipoprotein N-acyltransferase [Epsilonproteobacteria bacterium]|nr:apolipoprotein N-acyltransferase [Campylobacterota bacterium]